MPYGKRFRSRGSLGLSLAAWLFSPLAVSAANAQALGPTFENPIPRLIESLKKAGLPFRNTMETGPGGRQIQIEDPDGNPIELFEPGK